MIDRLAIVKQRFDEVSDLIIQPYIIADQKRYVALNREYKDLSALMEKRTAYLNLTQRQQEAEEIISDGSDPEMTDIAKEELEEEIGRAHVRTPVTEKSRMPSSA